MGFCRRCGEIVPAQTARCKCGGSAVAPVVQWNNAIQKSDGSGSPDRWAETYVSNKTERHYSNTPPIKQSISPEKEIQYVNPNPTRSDKAAQQVNTNQSPTRPARRFPRPLSTSVPNLSFADSRVSHHITSATMQPPRSPSKRDPVLSLGGSPRSTPEDVIASPDNDTLAKAYGSVLQRPETLPIHTCASCSTIFSPDATIYPDPQASSGGTPCFLCRPCFVSHGGSKGECAGCGREVLTITREGGFVESAGKVWHKRCFRCEGCFKEMGHAPMVDLFGRPSCAECFDSCLERRDSPRSQKRPEPANNIGGLRGRSRESSPALEELSERIGVKRRPHDSSVSPSPIRVRSGSRGDTEDTLSHNFSSSMHLGNGTPPRQDKMSALPRQRSVPLRAMTNGPGSAIEPTTPDLSSASSDSLSSYAPSTPSNSPRQPVTPNSRESITPKAKGTPTRLNTIATTGEAKCSRCALPLFNTSGGGKIVTVPAENAEGFPTSYHASCFRCFVCGDIFDGETQGHAMFVKSSRGISHPECISMSNSPLKPRLDRLASSTLAPNRSPERPPASAPPVSRSFPRFGGSETCPGCREPVSLMQYGVVAGPQNSRWHGNCLVCGGKGAKLPRPGCGKKLDSAAKTDREGGVWCRECMLLLPVGTYPSPQGSPTRAGVLPHYTGTGPDRFARPESGRLFGQVTGNEAGRLFGQVTGNAYERSEILARQFTGGGLSPVRRGSVSPTRQMTRSVSPTKGLIPVTKHPRPVSWKHRSVDEGRGMFLVRQMTGTGL